MLSIFDYFKSLSIMQSYLQSAPLTATLVLAGTVLVLAVSLALIASALFMLTYLKLPQITIPTTF